MANAIVKLPTGYFPDPDKGRPLFNAQIYIGEPDLNPRIDANQKTVTGRQEDGTEVTLEQPIRTNSGGVPIDGSDNVVVLLVDGAYSMAVDDRQDNQKYYFDNVYEGAPLTFNDNPVLYRDTVAIAVADESLSIGQYITTKGYTTENDGGGANYVVVAGGTGTDDGGSYIDLDNGNQLELILSDTVIAAQWGVIGDGSTDNLVQLQRAVDFAAGGIVDLPEGDILLEGELTISSEGTWVRGLGAGTFFDGIIGYKTRLIGTSETGAVVRIQIESCRVSDLLIDASSARSSAPRDTTAENFNCGLRIEAEDVAAPEGDVFDTTVDHVHVANQPNDGIVIIGRCYGTTIRNTACSFNGGNGLCLSNGEYTSRTNTAICGLVSISNNKWSDNNGHGIRCGSYNETDNTFRVHVENSEGLNNGGDQSLLEDICESFYHCDGLTVINGAATGTDKSGTDNALAGYTVMGFGGTLIETRVLDPADPYRIIKHPNRDCRGWSIQGVHIRGASTTYAVYVDADVENVKVWIGDTTGAFSTATNITGTSGLETYLGDIKTTNLTSTFIGDLLDFSGRSLSATVLDNNNVTTTPLVILDASETGKMWKLSARHSSDPCLSSVTATIVGGSTPVVSDVVNQSGSAVTYLVTVNSTDIEIATSSGTRVTDIYITELVVQ